MRRRTGFTLVELLVVIAIIGILVALLLPAVQAAREAARRMQCSNRLKQIALAAHNYHDTYRVLPVGFVRECRSSVSGTVNCGSGGRSFWSWGALMLPYLEQAPLYDQLGVSRVHLQRVTTAQMDLMKEPIGTFRCPSDVGPALNNQNYRTIRTQTAGTNNQTAVSNYLGVNSSWDTRWTGDGVFRVHSMQTNPRWEAMAFRFVLDGTSNTLMFGERQWQRKDQATGVIRIQGAGLVFAARKDNGGDQWGYASCLGAFRTKINSTGTGSRRGFSSQHPGGAQFALVDGSVRFIPESTEHKVNGGGINVDSVIERLASRQDGEPVAVP